jgi:hypothetical protein
MGPKVLEFRKMHQNQNYRVFLMGIIELKPALE